MDVRDLLEIVVKNRASDLHLLVGTPPTMRVDSRLKPLSQEKLADSQQLEALIAPLLSDEQKEMLTVNKELDFSFAFKNEARIRGNIYHQKGTLAAAFRLIPLAIPTIEGLGLPAICHDFVNLTQGLILVTGPTGHGKTTTLAAMIGEINQTRDTHVITIEDPIEYVHEHQKSIISQREMRSDCHSWEIALRSALREDPDVVMVGEMRDFETIAATLTVAETGHLVFATLHTNSAAQTIDRIVDVFPPHQQTQVKAQLAGTLEAVLSQRLLPATEGGRMLAYEVMLGIPAVKTAIREGKTHMLDNVIQTSGEVGMTTLEMSLARLAGEGKITLEEAMRYALRPDELPRLIRQGTAKKGKK